VIRVEKGIPIPGRQYLARKYPFANMEVGHSFFVACKRGEVLQLMNSLTSCRTWAEKQTGCKFTLRQVRSPFKGQNGVRVWRVK
jgi:hypothetical protein